MELDLSAYRSLLIALAAVLLLAGLGWLGYSYLPAGDMPLMRQEWQILKARSAYRKELGKLQSAADILVGLLNAQPDPVRAELTNESLQRLTSSGQPALAYQRETLALASQAVSDWAVGGGEREAARQMLQQAIQALRLEDWPESSASPTPISTRSR